MGVNNQKPTLFAVTSKFRLILVDIDTMQAISSMQLNNPAHLVRAFKELPDVAFVAVQQGTESFLQMHSSAGVVRCEEPHAGFILDIHVLNWDNQVVIFTACQDQQIRAFTLSQDRKSINR